jgi:hypothetical protein
MPDILDKSLKNPYQQTVDRQQSSISNQTSGAQTGKPVIPFRDDIQKEEDRKSKERIETIKTAGDIMKSTAQKPFNAVEGMGVKTPPAYQAFDDTLRRQDPAYKALQSAVTTKATENLLREPQGLGEQSKTIAINDLARALMESRAEQKQEAIRTYGPGTGQVGSVMRDFDRQGVLQRQDLAGRLAVEDAALRDQQSSQAMSDAITALQTGTEAQRLEVEQSMHASDQALELKLQEQGHLNTKDLEEYRADVEKSLTEMGFDQQTAMQIADHKHNEMMQASDQVFQRLMDENDKKWLTGERLSAQEHEENIQIIQNRHDESMINLKHVLNLEIQENQHIFEDATMKANIAHEYALTELKYSEEQALQHSQNVFIERMTELGFTHDQASQASKHLNDMALLNREIESKENMLTVQMAAQDKQFAAELGLKEQEIQLQKDALLNDIRNLDLKERELSHIIEMENVQNDLNMVATAMELLPDDEEVLKPFTDRLFHTLASELGIPEEDIQRVIDTSGTDESGIPKPTGDIDIDAPRTINAYIDNGDLTGARDYLDTLQTDDAWQAVLSDTRIIDSMVKQGVIVKSEISPSTVSRARDAEKIGLKFRRATQDSYGGGHTDVDQLIDKDNPTIAIVRGVPYKLDSYNRNHISAKNNAGDVTIKGINLLNGKKETIMSG